MDLSKLAAAGKTYEIRHPVTGENIGVRLVMVSLEDDKLRKLRRAIMDRSSKLQLRGKSFTAAEQEKNYIDLLFAAVQGWEWYGDANFNGEKPVYTRENFATVCEKLPWFRDQIDAEVSEVTNFISA